MGSTVCTRSYLLQASPSVLGTLHRQRELSCGAAHPADKEVVAGGEVGAAERVVVAGGGAVGGKVVVDADDAVRVAVAIAQQLELRVERGREVAGGSQLDVQIGGGTHFKSEKATIN